MATTGDAPLSLTKPEASDVVSLSVINTNYDTINTKAASVDSTLTSHTASISTLNTAVSSAGVVARATNVAGGLQKQIPIQSGANTTTFIGVPASAGKQLSSTLSSPYAVWIDPIPYKMASGTIASGDWASGVASVNLTSYGFTAVPNIVLSPVSSNLSLITSVSISSTPTATAFSASARSYNGTAFANASPVTHWVAIQLTA